MEPKQEQATSNRGSGSKNDPNQINAEPSASQNKSSTKSQVENIRLCLKFKITKNEKSKCNTLKIPDKVIIEITNTKSDQYTKLIYNLVLVWTITLIKYHEN